MLRVSKYNSAGAAGKIKTQLFLLVAAVGSRSGRRTGNKNRKYRFQQAKEIKGRFVIVLVDLCRLVMMYEFFVFHSVHLDIGLTIRLILKVYIKSKKL